MPNSPKTADFWKPRRRWFQFRLRTLLVAVMLFSIPCGYVAHEASIVRARKRWLAQERKLMAINHVYCASGASVGPLVPLPVVRRLLGDESQDWVAIFDPAKEAAVRELFPEARSVWTFTCPTFKTD